MIDDISEIPVSGRRVELANAVAGDLLQLGLFTGMRGRCQRVENSLGTRFRPGSATKHTGFGAIRVRFLVAISPTPTFSTRWCFLRS